MACQEIKYALHDEMIEVYYSPSVQNGIKQFIKQDFCLVIIGFAYPESENMELLKLIHQVKPIPILILSSKSGCENHIAAFKAGAHGYLEKPYNLEECLAQAKSLIELHIQLYKTKDSCYELTFGSELRIAPLNRKVPSVCRSFSPGRQAIKKRKSRVPSLLAY